MILDRRQVLSLSLAAGASAALGLAAWPARATPQAAQELIAQFTGGAEPLDGRITLSAPEVAENGNAVAVSFSVDSAMEGDDMVEAVMLVAEGNPNPDVATFHFTAMSGLAAASTRMRLAQTQTITAVARMADGSFHSASRQVEVTVGGCTG